MKAVLISIQPKWCELIASGKKTVEVRKTKPKLVTPFKCFIYETKVYDTVFGKGKPKKLCVGGGKVIGEFVCDKIYDITPHFDTPTFPNQYICEWDYGKDFDCLSFEELTSYLNGRQGYGWHISDLVIYDEPRGLSEFCTPEWFRDCEKQCDSMERLRCPTKDSRKVDKMCDWCRRGGKPITRPPQSWCYVERSENGT